MKKLFLTLLKKPFFGRFRVPWKNPLTEEQAVHWSPLEIPSKTGAVLQLLWRQTDNARGTVILGHPMGKAAKGVFLKNGHAQRLIDKGFNVMLFDFNGFGESGMGSFYYFEDVEAVVEKTKSLAPDLPLGYHGISLGGMWVSPYLSREHNLIDYAIIESASTSLPEFWKHYPLAYKVLMFSFALMPKKAEYLKPINHMSELKGVKEIFFIYSDSDIYTPAEMGERMHAEATIKKNLWIAQDAEHALIFKKYENVYWDKVIGFFEKNMIQ